MNTDYYEDMKISLDTIRNATSQEWEWEHTGGGCSAFILTLENGYYMITDEGACAPMLDELGDIILCWYADTEKLGEGVQVPSVVNLETLTKWAGK